MSQRPRRGGPSSSSSSSSKIRQPTLASFLQPPADPSPPAKRARLDVAADMIGANAFRKGHADAAMDESCKNGLTFASTTAFMSGLEPGQRPPHMAAPGAKRLPKLRILPLKVQPTLPPDFEAKSWAKLSAAIDAIFTATPVATSLEEIYRACETMCQNDLDETLYRRVRASIETHVVRIRDQIGAATPTSAAASLHVLTDHWTRFKGALALVRSVVMYLDRCYALPKGHKQVWDLGLQLFADRVLQGEIRSNCIAAALDLFAQLRRVQHVDPATRTLLDKTTEMLDLVALYESVYEPAVLDATRDFYRRQARARQQELDSSAVDDHEDGGARPSAYLAWVQDVLTFEAQCVHPRLLPRTEPLLMRVLHTELVAEHAALLLLGVPYWLTRGARDKLHHVYTIMSAISRVKPDLTTKVHLWCMDLVGRLVEEKYEDGHFDAMLRDPPHGSSLAGLAADANVKLTDLPPMTTHLLALKAHATDLITRSMASDDRLLGVVKDAFTAVMKRNANKPAEHMAKYVDHVLRLGKITNRHTLLERHLDDVLQLFRFVEAKDTFARFYAKLLARRLLDGKSTSIDAERAMIHLLGKECGQEYIESFNKMFTDVDCSRDLSREFAESDFGRVSLAQDYVDLSVTVCQSSVWPFDSTTTLKSGGSSSSSSDSKGRAADSPLHLPHTWTAALQQFERFYTKKHSGRQLTWVYDAGTLLVTTPKLGGKRAHELECSVYHALVLVLFNTHATLTMAEIQRHTGIPVKQLECALHSLSCRAQFRVLDKSPPNPRKILPSDTYTLTTDPGEQSKRSYKVRIPHVTPREVVEAQDTRTRAEVATDRATILDAAIVRVMKAHKSATQSDLFAEVCKQCRFHVDMAMFKHRVEVMMEREFIQRDKTEHNVYNYLA